MGGGSQVYLFIYLRLEHTASSQTSQLHFCVLPVDKWKQIVNPTPFIVAPKKMKYLGVNLTKLIQDLCDENDNVPMEEMKGDLCKSRDVPC